MSSDKSNSASVGDVEEEEYDIDFEEETTVGPFVKPVPVSTAPTNSADDELVIPVSKFSPTSSIRSLKRSNKVADEESLTAFRKQEAEKAQKSAGAVSSMGSWDGDKSGSEFADTPDGPQKRDKTLTIETSSLPQLKEVVPAVTSIATSEEASHLAAKPLVPSPPLPPTLPNIPVLRSNLKPDAVQPLQRISQAIDSSASPLAPTVVAPQPSSQTPSILELIEETTPGSQPSSQTPGILELIEDTTPESPSLRLRPGVSAGGDSPALVLGPYVATPHPALGAASITASSAAALDSTSLPPPAWAKNELATASSQHNAAPTNTSTDKTVSGTHLGSQISAHITVAGSPLGSQPSIASAPPPQEQHLPSSLTTKPPALSQPMLQPPAAVASAPVSYPSQPLTLASYTAHQQTDMMSLVGNQAGGQLPYSQTGVQLPYNQAGGQLPYNQTGGQLPYNQAGGQLPYNQAGGQLPYNQAGGQLPYNQAGGQLPYNQAGGQLPYNQAGGKLPYNQAGLSTSSTYKQQQQLFQQQPMISPNQSPRAALGAAYSPSSPYGQAPQSTLHPSFPAYLNSQQSLSPQQYHPVAQQYNPSALQYTDAGLRQSQGFSGATIQGIRDMTAPRGQLAYQASSNHLQPPPPTTTSNHLQSFPGTQASGYASLTVPSDPLLRSSSGLTSPSGQLQQPRMMYTPGFTLPPPPELRTSSGLPFMLNDMNTLRVSTSSYPFSTQSGAAQLPPQGLPMMMSAQSMPMQLTAIHLMQLQNSLSRSQGSFPAGIPPGLGMPPYTIFRPPELNITSPSGGSTTPGAAAAAAAVPALQRQNQIQRPQGLVASSADLGSSTMPFLQRQMQILSTNIAAAAAAAAAAMKIPLVEKLFPGAAGAGPGELSDTPPVLERQKQIQGAAAAAAGSDDDDSDILDSDAAPGPRSQRGGPSKAGSDSGSDIPPDPATARAAAAAAAAAEEAAQLEPDAPLATDLGPLLFGRPIGMPRLDQTINPQLIGPNFLFFSGLGYIFALCTQSYNIQVGTGGAGWFYFFAVTFGWIAFSTKLRKVSWYYMDVLLLLLFILMWGLTYPTPEIGINSNEITMQNYFPFIVNAPLCALCLGTAIFQYPLTLNYIKDTSPEEHWEGTEVKRAAMHTTIALGIAFLLSTTIYAAPFQQGIANAWPGQYSTDGGSLNFLTLLIRIIIPVLLFVAALLMIRFWYSLWWLRPSWLPPLDVAEELEGEALNAADAAEAKSNEGPKGAARRFISDNYILFSAFPLLAATCWQMLDVRIGLGVGFFSCLLSVGLGYLAFRYELRKTKFYNFELLMTLLFLVLFVMTAAPNSDGSPSSLEFSIQNNFNFIVFATLSGLALLSCIFWEPFTVQYLRDMVPKHHWSKPEIHTTALRTTWLWSASFAASVLIYLAAYEVGTQNSTWGRYGSEARGHDGAAAAIGRVVVPAFFIALSAMATRFWWRAWLMSPNVTGRPTWMHDEDKHMVDAAAGAQAATLAGSSDASADDEAEESAASGAAAKSGHLLAASGVRYLVCTELVGPNYQLFSLLGLLWATAWQTRNMLIGAGGAGFFYIGSVFYGSLAWRAGLRKVPVYWQEVVMGAIFFLLWAISYPVPANNVENSPQALSIQNYFPFIVNGTLGFLSLASILTKRPFTLQFILETVIPAGWTKPQLLAGSYYSSLIWFMAYFLALIAYVIVYLSGIQGHTNGQYRTGGIPGQDNGATILLRVVVPIILYILAALFTRFWYLLTKPPWAIPAPMSEVPKEAPAVPESQPAPEPEPEPGPEPKATESELPPVDQPELGAQPQADYLQLYEMYMREMWRQYEMYMQQYQVPPPPQPEPPKQASNVPRFALLPEGSTVPSGAALTGKGTLGWGDEAYWANEAAAASWAGQLQGPLTQFLDSNYIIISSLGYVIATALQTYDLKIGVAVAGFLYLALILLGLLLRHARARKIWIFFMEVAMLLVFIVQWALTFPEGPDGEASAAELSVYKYFPFVTNATLGGVALLSSVLQYPFVLQYIRSMLPYAAWRHPQTIPVAHVCTWVWIMAYTASCLLYLIPFSQDVEMSGHEAQAPDNTLNTVFRIVIPIVLHVAALLFSRLYPGTIIIHVKDSQPFDMVVENGITVVNNPLAQLGGRPGLQEHQCGYIQSAANDAFVTYIDTTAGGGQKAPWRQAPPPWLQPPPGRGSSAAVAGDIGANLQLQHEVWRQLMEQQKAQLTRLRVPAGTGLPQQQASLPWLQQEKQQLPPLQDNSHYPSAEPGAKLQASTSSAQQHQQQLQEQQARLRQQRMPSTVTSYPPQLPLQYDDRTSSFLSYPVGSVLPPHLQQGASDDVNKSPRIPAYLGSHQEQDPISSFGMGSKSPPLATAPSAPVSTRAGTGSSRQRQRMRQ
ncbi:hypothetical protein CEUSTIGMA_g7039.t1 [Chlamydomonas eustigma]|uniref:Uncharacterized protein n=1 Tax=Chlamydomonas eustigma TaxID=1157962 RepID=A0A250X948_9CHLO|nr:hypothetical protein CEUSTIGMA_g7039.t1 [Chlamydomonas eustigma]|eukprot:GAX79598.1 hypothetical protein CEUSTIGMA_g7039.t1 [Chlamydomonas eustigma]